MPCNKHPTYNRAAFYVFTYFLHTMQTRIYSFCKSALVLSALVIGTAAHAHDDRSSFEDGQKNSWDKPAPSIYVDRHGGRGFGHVRHDWHFNTGHHSWMGWNQHSGSGNGGNGGMGGIGVSPVPEPQTEAMLLTGLVMLGALVRRKAKASR